MSHCSPSCLTIAFMLALAAGHATQAAPLFPNPALPGYGMTGAIACGDFNGDGLQDLVVANMLADTVSLYSGRSEGDFGPPSSFGVGEQPLSVAIGDLDSDGWQDLVTLNHGSADVSILYGRGDGSFGPQMRHSIGTAPPGRDLSMHAPLALAIGDFNRDTLKDLVAVNTLDMSVILGRGGTFDPALRFGAGLEPRSVTVDDFDSDGMLDVAVANYLSSDISLLFGLGDGTLSAETRFDTGLHPRAIANGDFNGDGNRDLATVNSFGVNPQNSRVGDVSVLLGSGDGDFMPHARFEVGESPLSLVVADPDRDGIEDLMVTDAGSNDLSFLRGRGDGTFAPHRRVSAGRTPYALVSSDFDANAMSDLAVTAIGSDNVSILFGLGDGTFGPMSRFGTAGDPQDVAAGDFDDDGVGDLAVVLTGRFPAVISVFTGRGDGTFDPAGEHPVGFDPPGIAAADLDRDSIIDLAVANSGSHDVSVLLGLGGASFAPEMRFGTGYEPLFVAIADLNHDGHPDLSTVNRNSKSVSILLGLGTGRFQVEQRSGTGLAPRAATIADFNGDGILDLAVTNTISDDASTTIAGDVSILLGHGDGTFAPETRLAAGLTPQWIVHGDFDRDGNEDLAVTNSSDAHVSIHLGRGDGTFRSARRCEVAIFPTPLAVADFNNDRALDLAVGSIHSDVISILAGRGDGTFEPERRFLAGRSPVSLITGDFNGDRAEDLVVANVIGEEIWILPNQRPDLDGDLFRPPDDCDESDAAIHPAAIELPGNLVDEDCDGDRGECDPCLPWANHGEYVNCVTRALNSLMHQGLLSRDQRDDLHRSAVTSAIGKRGILPPECAL